VGIGKSKILSTGALMWFLAKIKAVRERAMPLKTLVLYEQSA
jgi:hypothetical protein